MLGVFDKYRQKTRGSDSVKPAEQLGSIGYSAFRSSVGSVGSVGPTGTRKSTFDNPMMNAGLGEFGTPAAFNSLGSSFSEVSDNLNTGLGRDPESILYGKSNSQRQFVTLPAPSNVPDTIGFARQLYGFGNNCKAGYIWRDYGATSGSAAGINVTSDSQVCDGYNTVTSGITRNIQGR